MTAKEFLWISLLIGSASGFSVRAVGTTFIADLALVAGLVFAWPHALKIAGTAVKRVVLWGILLAPLVFLCMDLQNGTHVSDLIKGLGRNLVFCSAAIFMFSYMAIWGARNAIILLLTVTFSYTAAVKLGFGDDSTVEYTGFSASLKFHGVIYAAVLVYVLFAISRGIGIAAAIAASVTVGTVGDFRSGAVMVIVPPVILYVARITGRVKAHFVAISGLVLCLLGTWSLNEYFLDEMRFDSEIVRRRESSNLARIEMAEFTAQEIMRRPWTGYGSWSNAQRFQSQHNTIVVSVHSAFLQYFYEYGVLGAVFILYWFWIAYRGLVGIITSARQTAKDGVWKNLSVSFLWIVFSFNLIMGGILGYTRVVAGLTAGILLFTVHASSLQEKRRFGLRRSYTKRWRPISTVT